MLLMEFGFVWWIDTTVRLQTLNVDSIYEAAKQHGLVYHVTPKTGSNNKEVRTDRNIFQYLGEDSCKFRQLSVPDINSIIVYHNNMSKELIKVWARCALDKECAVSNERPRDCDVSEVSTGKCYNNVQIMFGILIRRLYHEEDVYTFMKILESIFTINRTDECLSFNCKI